MPTQLTEAIRRARRPTGWGEPDDHEAAREKLVPTTKPAVEAVSQNWKHEGVGGTPRGDNRRGEMKMRSKREAAWGAAAKRAALAKEADDPQEREHYARCEMRGPRSRTDASSSNFLM